MFKKMTDTEILNYLEKEMEEDLKLSRKAIKEWQEFRDKELLPDLNTKDMELFNTSLKHLNESIEGIKFHERKIEYIKHYLKVIKDAHKNDPYYLTLKDQKEVCSKCEYFFHDKLSLQLCQNLELGHKCRIHFDDDGNRIKEK